MRAVLFKACAALFIGCLNGYLYVRYWRLLRMFVQKVGYWPNLANPKTFNEKINWRKIFDRNPEFTRLQDKLAARDYVKACCPDIAMPEILWIGSDPNEIPFDAIDRPVVIKTNHGCGYNYFIRDPEKIDRLDAVLFFTNLINRRWGAVYFEWAYEDIKPRIFIEEMLMAEDGLSETDYKVDVCQGAINVSHIVVRRPPKNRKLYFDGTGTPLDVYMADFEQVAGFQRLPEHDRMDRLAEQLCAGMDAMRADFYLYESRIYFGEFAVYPDSGFTPHRPLSFDYERGEPWDITQSHFFLSDDSRFRRIYRECVRLNSTSDTDAGNPIAADRSARKLFELNRETDH